MPTGNERRRVNLRNSNPTDGSLRRRLAQKDRNLRASPGPLKRRLERLEESGRQAAANRVRSLRARLLLKARREMMASVPSGSTTARSLTLRRALHLQAEAFRQTGPVTRQMVETVQAPFRESQGFFRRLVWLITVTLTISGILLAAGIVTYAWIASELPPAEALRARTHQFATTQILDQEGNLLWEILDPSGGRRTDVRLYQISPHLINATLATEDRFFYLNIGVDPIAITRAVYRNLTEQRIVSGGSTITQQLARDVLLAPQERAEKTFNRKLREAVLAVEISRRYTKNQILEIYFNQIYYGNLAYGIEAAAQTYFGKSAKNLTLPEAALLAGLPQSPVLHDPYLNPARAKARQEVVLGLMVKAGFISQAEATRAANIEVILRDPAVPLNAPHFVTMVRQELERTIPANYLYRVGLRVHTTLDPELQAIAEEEVRRQVEALKGRNVTNGALVALDAQTGQILALVGSNDYGNKTIDGQVNMVTSPRQPGSTMKPLTYLTAFEQLGWTPSTLLIDTPVEYPETDGTVYRPRNVDGRFHGAVLLRTALASSYNIPAVKTLEQVGVEALKETAARLGVTTLTGEDYGLSLTLGSGEISLLELTGVYQALANGGVQVKPTTIAGITDNFGRTIEPSPSRPKQVLRAEHAYLLTDILADPEARRPGFGADSPLYLSRPAAVKTGTTNDFRDNWAIGYTAEIVAGVWLGNADNTPMREVGSDTGAAPIWHNFMERAHQGLPVSEFTRPPGIVELEICADSGTLPSDLCPRRRTELFFRDQPPLGSEYDMHRFIAIDARTGLLAAAYCPANVEKRYYKVYPPEARDWAVRHRIPQPPTRFCPSDDIVAGLSEPVDNVRVWGVIEIRGSAVAEDLAYYQLELGLGTQPEAFTLLQAPLERLVAHDVLAFFDTTQLENGPYTLRLIVADQTGGFKDARVRVLVDNPPALVTPRTPVTTPPLTPTAPLTGTLTNAAPLTGTLGLTTTLAPVATPEQVATELITIPLEFPPLPVEGTPGAEF